MELIELFLLALEKFFPALLNLKNKYLKNSLLLLLVVLFSAVGLLLLFVLLLCIRMEFPWLLKILLIGLLLPFFYGFYNIVGFGYLEWREHLRK